MKQWSFVEHVTKSLLEHRSGDPKPPTLWPSEASAVILKDGKEKVVGKCRRAIFFRYLLDNMAFYPRYQIWEYLARDIKLKAIPPDKYLLWIWKQGELYEEYLVEQAKISGIFISAQLPVYIQSHNVSGKKDLEVVNPTTGKIKIVEAKSVYSYGANTVLGMPGKNRTGGVPRDSNLMQIALYHWWHASSDASYEESVLTYGSRDTGRYGEYLVRTVEELETHIEYAWNTPFDGKWIRSPITIENILEQYHQVQLWLDSGVIPNRDFDILYSEEQLAECYENEELNRTERTQYEKVMGRRAEIRIAEETGGKAPRALKQIEKGHYMCSLCSYRNVCYNENNEPREL